MFCAYIFAEHKKHKTIRSPKINFFIAMPPSIILTSTRVNCNLFQRLLHKFNIVNGFARPLQIIFMDLPRISLDVVLVHAYVLARVKRIMYLYNHNICFSSKSIFIIYFLIFILIYSSKNYPPYYNSKEGIFFIKFIYLDSIYSDKLNLFTNS